MGSQGKSQGDRLASEGIQNEAGRCQRILVVDDELIIRRLNTGMLVLSGYEVDAADNGASAWDALQVKRYDLLITDNDMPKVTGIDLIKRVRATRVALPVIMATGKFPLDEFTRHPHLQPAVTLLKPYTFDDLVCAVKIVFHAIAAGAGAKAAPVNRPAGSAAMVLRL
jgi:DNA-binding NtrC family response regulator